MELTAQYVFEKILTYVVLPLVGFLIGVKMELNKLRYNQDQSIVNIEELKEGSKSNIVNFTKKLDGHSKRLNKLDKEQGIMNNDMNHIKDGIDEIKEFMREIRDKS